MTTLSALCRAAAKKLTRPLLLVMSVVAPEPRGEGLAAEACPAGAKLDDTAAPELELELELELGSNRGAVRSL